MGGWGCPSAAAEWARAIRYKSSRPKRRCGLSAPIANPNSHLSESGWRGRLKD